MAEIPDVAAGAAGTAAMLIAFALMLIGFVLAAALMRGSGWKRNRVKLFAVIPVGDGESELDTDICAARSALERSGAKGELLLLDVGADEEMRRICERRFGELVTAQEIGARMLVAAAGKQTDGTEKER